MPLCWFIWVLVTVASSRTCASKEAPAMVDDRQHRYGHPITCTCVDCVEKRLNSLRAKTTPRPTTDPNFHPPGCPCDSCVYGLRARYLAALKERPIATREAVGEQPATVKPEVVEAESGSQDHQSPEASLPETLPVPAPKLTVPARPVASRSRGVATSPPKWHRSPRRRRPLKIHPLLIRVAIAVGLALVSIIIAL